MKWYWVLPVAIVNAIGAIVMVYDHELARATDKGMLCAVWLLLGAHMWLHQRAKR